ncbi:hypothetical protein [Gaiella sp.]|uniref:hypothetical protein n=1 Tax=Gaiella sp. TaxID=2663207 RepID=UPI0039834724
MEEKSHKDEMDAALRGDFERMRRRQAGEGDPVGQVVESTAALTSEEPLVTVDDASSGSWLDRILGRS